MIRRQLANGLCPMGGRGLGPARLSFAAVQSVGPGGHYPDLRNSADESDTAAAPDRHAGLERPHNGRRPAHDAALAAPTQPQIVRTWGLLQVCILSS